MKEQGMSILVKRITRMTVSLILLYGFYIAFHGHLSPGGGFAGGVIFALSMIHITLAFGREGVKGILSKAHAALLESAGALAFLLIGVAGILTGTFFLNFLPAGYEFQLFSGGTMVFSNLAIFVKVGAGLFAVFAALAFLGPEGHAEEGDGGEQ